MQVFAYCMSCLEELGHPTSELIVAPYYEDRSAIMKCSRGHESALMLQALKFEVLLNSGSLALAAGFTLEAAASFSAALERFFELCIRTMLVHQGLSATDVEPVFSEMSRQSERQIGAFIALHRLVLGKPYSPNKKIIEFRNSVIHKGQIPNPLEVEEFCERVYAEISKTTNALKIQCSAAIQTVVTTDIMERMSKIPKDIKIATFAGGLLFSLVSQTNPPDFKSAFEIQKKWANVLEDSINSLSKQSTNH